MSVPPGAFIFDGVLPSTLTLAIPGPTCSSGRMITDKLKALAQLKAEAAKIEASLEAQRPAALAALPAEYGFADPGQTRGCEIETV